MAKGNLWFGTLEKGVAKYDGKKLTYSLLDTIAHCEGNISSEQKEKLTKIKTRKSKRQITLRSSVFAGKLIDQATFDIEWNP